MAQIVLELAQKHSWSKIRDTAAKFKILRIHERPMTVYVID